MKDRLQQFLDLKNISAARLADMMGIQRSALSHILGGRNKPSYDFISKFITLFPYVNAEWFITGKGEAFKNMISPDKAAPSQTPAHIPAMNTAPAPTIVPAPVPAIGPNLQTEPDENDDDFPIAVKKEEKAEKADDEVKKELCSQERRISKIVVLFSDGTYQEMK